MCFSDIPKFVKQNNISVQVIGYEKETYFPAYQTYPELEKHVSLLLFEKDGESHYCLIRNVDRMLSSQTKHNGKRLHCSYCFHGFGTEKLLNNHREYCQKHGYQVVMYPGPEEQEMKFTQVGKMLRVPFVIYADFECILERTGEDGKINSHKPCGYSYLVVSDDENYQPEIVTYSDENVLEHFFESILSETTKLMEKIRTNKTMIFNDEDKRKYEKSTVCHICEKTILKNEEHIPKKDRLGSKVRDHCHLTGKFRGAAHSKCNLAYRVPHFIPVFFHNLEGYDSHLLMQKLGKYVQHKITCIAKSMEKYISFNMGRIRFLDSCNFMSESLGNLVNNLATDGDKYFHHMKRHFPNEVERNLLIRKGVYPYEWMDNMNKMNYTNLPLQENFYSTLTMQHITDEDYKHAQNVWNTFGMSTMKDYHDLYLQTDVLLLADCFENFRRKCLDFYKLDPAHFYTTPGLSWNAALQMTGVKLELLTEEGMHLMVEEGVKRRSEHNNNKTCKS